MEEMRRRGYNPDKVWYQCNWRGTSLGLEENLTSQEAVDEIYHMATLGKMIYPEHNDNYLRECINLLKEKNAPIDWEKVEQDGLLKI